VAHSYKVSMLCVVLYKVTMLFDECVRYSYTGGSTLSPVATVSEHKAMRKTNHQSIWIFPSASTQAMTIIARKGWLHK
jgi:hypothetical protein